METVAVQREYDVAANGLKRLVTDVESFYDAAGFEVERHGDRLELTKRLAVARFELEVALIDDADAALAYEQLDGPFGDMETRYLVEDVDDGSRLTIETSFEPPASGFGTFLNGALIKRQRGSELDAVDDLLADGVVPAGERDGE